MIHCSYVFVNRKTEISKNFFRRIFALAGGVQLRKNPAVTGENFRGGGRKAAKLKSASKISYFFEKYALCLLTNE